MNKKHTLFLLLLLTLASCNSNDSGTNFEIKLISPAGAPTFAFYDKGDDKNFVTDSVPSNVSKQLLGNEYNAVVFDSINGLNFIKKNGADFKLATLITGGNFYIVSYGKNEHSFPTKDDSFVSFSENGLPDLVFKKLKESYDGWSDWNFQDATYLQATSDVSQSLISHQYDYYFIAEPSLFAAKQKLGEDAKNINVVANLKESWSSYSGMPSLPQAGLFFRTSTYSKHKEIYDNYLKQLNERKDICVDNPILAKQSIDQWNSDNIVQQARFGYASAVAYNVQKDGNNGLGIVKSNEITSISSFVNQFIEKLGNSSYQSFGDEYFVN